MCRGRCAWYDGVKKMRLRAQSTRQCFVCKICWGNEMIESTLAIRDKFFLSILFYFRSLKLWIVLSFHLFLYSCFFLHIFIHFSLFERLPFSAMRNRGVWNYRTQTQTADETKMRWSEMNFDAVVTSKANEAKICIFSFRWIAMVEYAMRHFVFSCEQRKKEKKLWKKRYNDEIFAVYFE